MGPQGLDDEVAGLARPQRGFVDHRQQHVAEPVLSVHRIGGRLDDAVQRLPGAPDHRSRNAEPLLEEQRIAGGAVDVGIADHGGDAEQFHAGQLAQVEQRHGVVDARIGVEDDFH